MEDQIATRDVPPLALRAAFRPGSVRSDKRTVELVWSTGARVLRGFFDRFYEELSLDPKHVRMGRLASGRAPLLNSHSQRDLTSILGVVESARLEGHQGVATVRFAKAEDDPEADRIFRKVSDGIITNISVGYRVYRFEKIEDGEDKIPVYRATDWEPFELSLVGMPADAGAGVRSEGADPKPCVFVSRAKEAMMDPTPQDPQTIDPGIAAERERVAGILDSVRAAKLEASFADQLIRTGVPLDDARAQVLNRLATRDEQIQTVQHIGVDEHHPGAEAGGGYNSNSSVRLMAEALASRFGGPPPSEPAKQYVRMQTVDMARHALELRGASTKFLSRSQIISRGLHSTSDFPALLQETGNRLLRKGFESYPGGIRTICRQSTAPDFRAKSLLMLGEAPQLERVNEHGEFRRGTMAEAKASYSLSTYGKIFGVTRQALVNDDLGAFADLTLRLGRSAAEFIALQLVDLLAGNPEMGDGKALFHADHGNLGTPGTISVETLGEALKLMRLQKGLDGKTSIDVTPQFLVVPASLEILAKQHVAQINATKPADTNPFTSANLEVVVDPRLDADSETAWYLAANPQAFDTIEYSFLEGGAQGPEFETRAGFDVDGLETRIRLDFGCGVIDHRGLVKNEGAVG